MRKSLLIACLLVGAAVGATAQDKIFTNFHWWIERPLPPAPCTLLGSAQPVVYDTNLWVFYTCTDNRVLAHRFLHPNDGIRAPIPVTIHQPPPPPPAEITCYGNFVRAQGGGCVPPDHPLAVRNN